MILNEGDTAKVTIDPTDLLFIDSLHTGEHLRKELFRHHLKVNKYNYILFSPGGESFDYYKNYLDRGKHFNKIIKKVLF